MTPGPLRLAAGLLVCVLGAVPSCADTPPTRLPRVGERPAGWVDVRLAAPDDGPRLGADRAWEVWDGDGEVVHAGDRLAWDTVLAREGDVVRLGDVPLGGLPLEVRPVDGGTLRVGSRRYRGLLRLEDDGRGGVRVVNRVSIEDYLRGVLPGEMPDRFGLEALKAQAVAARSYALAEAAQRGWLHPDVRSQVYKGRDAETWLASEAVRQTAGQVLTHEGRVIPAWFQSTCGGGTARAQDVFLDPPDGVLDRRVVCADCRDSPTWSWTRSLDGAVVCAAVGLPEAPLEEVRTEPGLYPGRPDRVVVVAGGLEASVPAVDFRDRVSKGRPWDAQLLSTRWAAPPRVEEGRLVVEGHGWGHGVGLCQYGARGFARRGAGYRVILRRYYPDARLVELS